MKRNNQYYYVRYIPSDLTHRYSVQKLCFSLKTKSDSTTGLGNLLICTIIIPASAILLNSILIKEMLHINDLFGLLKIILELLIVDGGFSRYFLPNNIN